MPDKKIIMMKAPFPYFGGKSKIAPVVWELLGQPDHYLEPFFGSGATLLNRQGFDPTLHTETVNDMDGHVCNVWRAIQLHPEETAAVCDWPVNHADLMARKARLIRDENYLLENLCRDDKWCDIELAGYWIWAASCWIGHGLTSPGQRPHLGDKGHGVHAKGQRPHLTDKGQGVHAKGQRHGIYDWFAQLAERLRYVRVVCGDWSRICGGDWQDNNWKTVGYFFDPPYSCNKRNAQLYHHESMTVAQDVAAWCLARGDRENYRIVLAGYEGEYDQLLGAGWREIPWKAQGGYANVGNGQGKTNRHRERLFVSPHCLGPSCCNGNAAKNAVLFK